MALEQKIYKRNTDEFLMQKIGEGDEVAFTELYTRYSQKMYRYFYQMFFQNSVKAEDFVQDLFIKIIDKPQHFNSDYPFSHWIYSVASNMCKNEFRDMSRKDLTSYINESQKNVFIPLSDDSSDDQLFKSSLQSALSTLEERHRECFILRFQEGMTVEETSEILNCPQGTVKSRIYYALKKLAAQLVPFQNYIK